MDLLNDLTSKIPTVMVHAGTNTPQIEMQEISIQTEDHIIDHIIDPAPLSPQGTSTSPANDSQKPMQVISVDVPKKSKIVNTVASEVGNTVASVDPPKQSSTIGFKKQQQQQQQKQKIEPGPDPLTSLEDSG